MSTPTIIPAERDAPNGFTIELPAWLIDEQTRLPRVLPDRESRMQAVNALADRNFVEGNGGPFAALIADTATGEVIAYGVNTVLSTGISAAHAEVTTIGVAQARLRTWDLGTIGEQGLELVVNWRPCTQCFGAMLWSGVRTLVIAGDGPELEALTGFDEGPMVADWREQLAARGIDVVEGVGHEGALATFAAYGAAVADAEALRYNARVGASGA